MRAVIQRVAQARVLTDSREVAAIGAGLLVLVGVAEGDGQSDLDYLSDKLVNLRIMSDAAGRMNRSVLDCGGEVLLVSQFTLMADTRKGRRPSFTGAAAPEVAQGLLEDLARSLRAPGIRVCTGEFGAMMDVELVNRGPVTIVIDSSERNIPRRRV